MHSKIITLLSRNFGDKVRELNKDHNEDLPSLRGLTYQEVVEFEKKKFELLSKPIVLLIERLCEVEEQTALAEKALKKAQESHRATLRTACAEVERCRKQWSDYKSRLHERGVKVTDDVKVDVKTIEKSAPKIIISFDGDTISSSNLRNHVSLSGSPFANDDCPRRSIEYVQPVRRLIFDDSSIASTPLKEVQGSCADASPLDVTYSEYQKPGQDPSSSPPSPTLPEMPHFQSRTMREVFGNNHQFSTKKHSKCSAALELFSEKDYAALDKELQSEITREQLNDAILALNKYLSFKNLGTHHLSHTALMAILVPEFSLKQCGTIFLALTTSGRLDYNTVSK